MTVLAQDVVEAKKKGDVIASALLVRAARESGRSPFSIGFDFLKLRKKRGGLKFSEYVLYELHDRSRWTQEERESFVAAHAHWPLVKACNDQTWWAQTEDKWLSAAFLESNDLPIPDTLAVFDTSVRSYGKTPQLKTGDDLKAFLSARKEFPIFAKPIGGMWSAGALRIAGHTGTHVLLDGRDAMTYDAFATKAIGTHPYILQNCVTPHSFFDGVTTSLPTVRALNIIDDKGLTVPQTLLKLPLQGNIADNFWRSGNVLCNVDAASGEILNIVTVKDGRRTLHDALPGLERTFIGECLPDWDALKTLNEQVALLHAPNRFGSTDIALTVDGPVVVEVNNGCAFELMQLATGKGFLDAKMTAFFRAHGAKI